uniref:Coiled-coil domain containing 134 n=1 Tax=Sinocyclocheilus rhinocerous TaxID=307959 RepID=A0A673LET4_9TELE
SECVCVCVCVSGCPLLIKSHNYDIKIQSLCVPLAYSHVVENTAFFGDVALRFPRIVHHYYDQNVDWSGLLRWGLRFCNQTGVFSGGAHQHVLTLMSQELGITEKSADFVNPYRTERDDVLHTAEAFQKILREEEKRRRKEEKRKEIRKGPRISRSRTEL